MREDQRKSMIRALLEERQMCVVRGKEDRVKEIDFQLKLYGQEGASPAKRAEKRPVSARKSTR
jgi:hypothetical protein